VIADLDINECKNENICPKCASCRNTAGAYECVINKGWEGFGSVLQPNGACNGKKASTPLYYLRFIYK